METEISKNKSWLFIGILIVLYCVGVLGISINIFPAFIYLTPINLLVSTFIILAFHKEWGRDFILFTIVTYLLGFSIEYFGVNTGLIFGTYTYGDVLGPKIGDTPLMIGVNWLMLSYSAGITVNHLLGDRNLILKSIVASSILVILDFIIEPVAIHYNFWTWEAVNVPIKNYIAWFVIAFTIQLFFNLVAGKSKNKVAIALLLLQFAFFGFLCLLLN